MTEQKSFLESLGLMLAALGVVGAVFGILAQTLLLGHDSQLPLAAESGLVLGVAVALLILGLCLRAVGKSRRNAK